MELTQKVCIWEIIPSFVIITWLCICCCHLKVQMVFKTVIMIQRCWRIQPLPSSKNIPSSSKKHFHHACHKAQHQEIQLGTFKLKIQTNKVWPYVRLYALRFLEQLGEDIETSFEITVTQFISVNKTHFIITHSSRWSNYF